MHFNTSLAEPCSSAGKPQRANVAAVIALPLPKVEISEKEGDTADCGGSISSSTSLLLWLSHTRTRKQRQGLVLT
jgi:hypothetical protein